MSERIIRNKFDRERLISPISELPSRTKQEFLEESNINNIMARYQKTGQITHLANGTPKYGDFATAEDYYSASNRVLEAQHTFDALPASVRDRMENNPANLISFMDDPDNLDEAVELGLVILREDPPTPPERPPEATEEPPPAE